MPVDVARLQTDQSYRADLRNQGYQVGSEGGQVYAQQVGGGSSGGGGGGGGGGTGGGGGGGTGANIPAAQMLLNSAQAAAQQAYYNAKLQLDSDTEAYQKAAQEAATKIAEAGVTGSYNGMPTQAAIKQAADLAQQQASTMLAYASQFGMWGPPSPGQQTLGAQQQAFSQGQQAGELTGWYTPYQYNAPTTQGNWAAVGTPSQPNMVGSPAPPGGLTWDQLAGQLQAAGATNLDDVKKLAFQYQGDTSGNKPLNISGDQLNQVISQATGGRLTSWAALTGGPQQGQAMPGQAAVGGQGYFVGTDGNIHVGSPTGTGQQGWGGGSGTAAAAGWAPGTTSSDPNMFLQAPGQAQAAQGQQQQAAQGTQYLGAPNSYQGGAVRTLAGQQQDYNQWLQAQNLALSQWQAQQGATQSYLSLLSNLRGPADYAKYQQVLGSTPGGMQDLVRAAAGQYIPGGGATTGVQPQAANLNTLYNQATGQAGAGSQQQMQQAQNTLVAPNQMAPQTWNALQPSQQQMLLGIWESQGYTKDDAQNLFNQSLPKYATQGPAVGGFKLQ